MIAAAAVARMMDIYLLPGLGTDHRLFSRLDLGGLHVRYLEWPDYGPGHTLRDIAHMLVDQVDTARTHWYMGVSMGGMVAQELAALTNPEKVVLMSSWIGPHEWPWHIRMAARLRPHLVINETTMRMTWPLKARLVGQGDPVIGRLLYDMACAQTARRIRHGVAAIMRWEGSPWKGPLVRIHGDADRLIPLRFPADHVVRGGKHTMVINSAEELGPLLRKLFTEGVIAV